MNPVTLALSVDAAAPSLPSLTPGIVTAMAIGMVILLGGLAADMAIVARLFLSPPRGSWRDMSARLAARPWRVREATVVVTGLIGAQLLLLAALLPWAQSHADPPPAIQHLALVAQTLTFHGLALVIVLRLIRQRGLTWREAFGLGDVPVPRAICLAVFFYLAAMPPIIGAALISSLLLKAAGVEPAPQDVVTLLLSASQPAWLKVYLALVAATFAPLVEEVLFRGVLLNAVARHARLGLALLATSVLFAAIHFNAASLLPLVVVAAAFALAYLYTGSLLVSILMHALFNTVSLALIFAVRDLPGLTGPA